jgi:hypothetical protein
MKIGMVMGVALAVGALGGCHKKPTDAAASDATAAAADAAMAADQPGFFGMGSKHGRYTAVGIYAPGQAWTKMAPDDKAADPAAAKQADDQAIIVVGDSQTGEIRACGDMTGHCIGMNPWKAPLVGGQLAPIKLTEHEGSASSAPSNASAAASASDAPPR